MFVHPDDRAYLKFSIDGRTFEPVTMPFGLLVSPLAWTSVMRPVLEHLRASGFTHIGYVDDHAAVPPGARLTSKAYFAKGTAVFPILADVVEVKKGSGSTVHWSIHFIRLNGWLRQSFTLLITPRDIDQVGQNWADSNIGFATVLYERLGLSLHPLKAERNGTQQLTLLGFTFDTAGNQVRLPDSRLARLRGSAAAVLASSSSHRCWVRRKPLESVATFLFRLLWPFPRQDFLHGQSTTISHGRRIRRGHEPTATSVTSRSGTCGGGRISGAPATAGRSGHDPPPTPCTPTRRGLAGAGFPTK